MQTGALFDGGDTASARAEPSPGIGDDRGTMQFLRFSLGEERCAVHIEAVREILDVVRMTPLPLMPAFVRGVMNLRGAVVPVIDMAARLGMGMAGTGRRSCVVVLEVCDVERGSERLGVLVDAVHEVFDAETAEQEPVPRLGTRINPRFIRSMVRVRGEAVAELDVAAALDQQALAELIASHTQSH